MKALARWVGIRRHRFTRFRWADYLALHPDLVAAGITTRRAARQHYRLAGKTEARRWYIAMPKQLLRSVPTAATDELSWVVARSNFGTPRTSVDAALRQLDTEQLLIAASLDRRDRVPTASDLDRWTTDLDAGVRSHLAVFADIAYIDPCWRRTPTTDESAERNESDEPIFMMGSVTMTDTEWHRRRHAAPSVATTSTVPSWAMRSEATDRVSNRATSPSVSVLCSLYRSEAHLDRLLGNLVEQTAFADSEFLMVATDPSPAELTMLLEATAEFPNLRLDIVKERIGIYEAWNRAARAARGRYLTNMNADDLRRHDSIERQREILDSAPWIDVVFQDVLLSLDPNTPWPVLEEINARTNFPPATPMTFMSYVNSPHNGPMWRRSLHDTIGWFDERYTSAGDGEFWLRAARSGAVFHKCNDAHVSYYLNPAGLSTADHGEVGSREHREVIAAHADLLRVGPPPLPLAPQSADSPPTTRADRVTNAYVAALRSAATDGAHHATPTGGRFHIVLDDQGIALGAPGTRDGWIAALTRCTPEVLALRGVELTILDRSGALANTGHRTVPCATRPWNSRYPAADREVLDRACASLAADLFITTANTFPTNTPAVTIDLCPTSWHPAEQPTHRELLECELAAIVAPRTELDDFNLVHCRGARSADFDATLAALHESQLRMQR